MVATQAGTETVERQGYSVPETARAIGCGITTVNKMLSEGRLRKVKVYGRTIIPKSEIQRLLNGDETA